jgi:hypothetical protein
MAASTALSILAVVASSIAMTPTATASPASSALAPVNPSAYKELSVSWWRWAASLKTTTDGPFAQESTNCGENQPEGNVFFLAGQVTDGPVVRTCEIPAGKRLFLPVINVECSSLEVDSIFFGGTPAERRACVEKPEFAVSELVAILDGQPIVPDLQSYEVVSRDFAFTAVSDNPVGIPAGSESSDTSSGASVSRGVWLLLAPLSPGEHTLFFSGYFAAFDFRPTATYHLTIP